MVHNGAMTSSQGGPADLNSLVTTVLQRSYRGPVQWWRDATVYDVIATKYGDPNLEATFASVAHAARLGVQAISFRPSHLDPTDKKDAQAIQRVIDRAHQMGLKAFVQVSGASHPAPASRQQGPVPSPIVGKEVDGFPLVDRAEAFLALGADGIELGLIVEPELTGQQAEAELLTAVVEKLKELRTRNGEKVILAATASAQFPSSLSRHLHQDWMHHLRDDRLQLSPWTGEGLVGAITSSVRERAKLDHPSAWIPNVNFSYSAFGPLEVESWFNEPTHSARRAQAVNLLALSLPGAIYLHQGDEVARSQVEDPADSHELLDSIAGQLIEQRQTDCTPYSTMRRALRVRAERRLGTGTLAVVTGAPWQGPHCIALQNRDVMAVTNLSEESIEIPHDWEVLVCSAPCDESGQSVVLPPQATVWLRIDA